ncbi:tRNA (adenosine(37)-N6)-threonylcarbamoyltransferase complex dimerization subunit type 1 TsaB [Thiohalospira sp.]|uniref:tRNA (adenosine(37)-N6)-threonylcarbamoyltransferase complex dimerization subunit type 1 TsaB n=1 Tax=Thiohalospira sp. TaxID=3080549 RepID=UPI00397FAAF1
MSRRILALEAATDACSVALRGEGVAAARREIAPRRHAELLLPWAEALLAEAEWSRSSLDVIAFGRGPGAFTGLRIAAGVTQGLALGLGRPVAPVSTLAALALDAGEAVGSAEAPVVVATALDARMGEVYWAPWQVEGEIVTPLGEEVVSVPTGIELPAGEGRWIAAGSGWTAHGEALRDTVGEPAALDAERRPDAAAVARLAGRMAEADVLVPAAEAVPVYLRPWRPGT